MVKQQDYQNIPDKFHILKSEQCLHQLSAAISRNTGDCWYHPSSLFNKYFNEKMQRQSKTDLAATATMTSLSYDVTEEILNLKCQ